ncbi:hypothetical protein ACVXG7_25760 [Enterobacter hormaechei]
MRAGNCWKPHNRHWRYWTTPTRARQANDEIVGPLRSVARSAFTPVLWPVIDEYCRRYPDVLPEVQLDDNVGTDYLCITGIPPRTTQLKADLRDRHPQFSLLGVTICSLVDSDFFIGTTSVQGL